MLKEINNRLETSIQESQNKLIRCDITGLYNFSFFKNYLASEINSILIDSSGQNPGLIIISLDNIERIEYLYGHDEVEEIQRNVVFLLESLKTGNEIFLNSRVWSSPAICRKPQKKRSGPLPKKLEIRLPLRKNLLKKLQRRSAWLYLSEIHASAEHSEVRRKASTMLLRCGPGLPEIWAETSSAASLSMVDYQENIGKILIVDSDEISVDVLKTALENINCRLSPPVMDKPRSELPLKTNPY